MTCASTRTAPVACRARASATSRCAALRGELATRGETRVVIRPERVRIEPYGTTGENHVPGMIERVVYLGSAEQLVDPPAPRATSFRRSVVNDGTSRVLGQGTAVQAHLPPSRCGCCGCLTDDRVSDATARRVSDTGVGCLTLPRAVSEVDQISQRWCQTPKSGVRRARGVRHPAVSKSTSARPARRQPRDARGAGSPRPLNSCARRRSVTAPPGLAPQQRGRAPAARVPRGERRNAESAAALRPERRRPARARQCQQELGVDAACSGERRRAEARVPACADEQLETRCDILWRARPRTLRPRARRPQLRARPRPSDP